MEKKELKKALKLAIENLIGYEIRLLRSEQAYAPSFVVEEVTYAIRESKRQVIDLARSMPQKERATLIRKLIREAVDEEIERALRVRKVRCLRCTHMRYYDIEGTPYVNFPVGVRQAEVIGCDEIRCVEDECRRFLEKKEALSLEDHLGEMALLYGLRETLLEMKKIWEDYLINP